MNELKPQSYEEWLAFTDEQREAVLFRWSQREAIGFAYIAAGRLVLARGGIIYDVRMGIYHGDEYILHAYVNDEVVPGLPKMLKQTFEGFRVAWLPAFELLGRRT